MTPQKTPFGGGNQFALNLIQYLENHDILITYKLEPDIDAIFIMDPRLLKFNKIDINQIKNFRLKYPNVKVVHRVNDCDKPRNQENVLDPILQETFLINDLTIFVSEWTKNYFAQIPENSFVIHNGCNRNYFYPRFNKQLNPKIKLVTHHWSSNALKGKDIYQQLDDWIADKNFEFIYIGREFPGKAQNAKVIGPFFGLELANHLREADIYISASQYENCPMHIIEGLSCGLPLIYHENIGGGCEIGKMHKQESFATFEELILKINLVVEKYNHYQKNIQFPLLSSNYSNQKYYQLLMDHIT